MTTHTPSLPLYVDSTMIATFRQCPRKFFYEFTLGLRPSAVSVDLHAGGCFAKALEEVCLQFYVHGKDLKTSLVRAFGVYMEEWGDFVPRKETSKSKERVWEAVEAYFQNWSPATDPVQPYILDGRVATEFSFGIPLFPTLEYRKDYSEEEMRTYFPTHPSGGPFIYSGRFDLLGIWNNKIVPRDEKTTTSISSNWAESWDLRSQFMGYVWACQQSGLDVDTVCVRGIGILKTKFHLMEAFKTYQDYKIARWYEQLRRDLWRLRRAWDEGYFDYNLADACTSYGGCAFRDPCSSSVPERWFDQYTVRRWNPLQKNPIAEEVKSELA